MPFKKRDYGEKECLNCGKEIKLKIVRDKTRKMFCSHSCRAKYYLKNGTIKLNRKGKNGNGGYISHDGYKLVLTGFKEHQYEHRKIIEDFLGRKLTKNEFIHHIDGDKLNNNIENLILCSKNEHFEIHSSLISMAYILVKKGQIKFDKKTKKYAV